MSDSATPGDLAGRVAVVSGAAAGIGAATARALATAGAGVLLVDRSPTVRTTAAELASDGLDVRAAELDVTLADGWRRVAADCRDTLGPPSILVNNAYVVDVAPLERTSLESWRRQLDVNLTGAFLAVSTLLPDLLATGSGAIVNVSSVHAHFGLPGRAAYAATKAGLTGFTRQLAVEYGHALRANSVLPGPILTAAWDDVDEEGRAASAGATALGRLGDPREVAAAIAFLASDRASFITGAELVVDGGWSIAKHSD